MVVSSAVSEGWNAKINFDDVNQKRSFRGTRAYAWSKAANVMFAYKMAEILEGELKIYV